MELSLKTLKEITTGPKNRDYDGGDRRRSDRVSYHGPATILPVIAGNIGEPRNVKVQDLSTRSIGLVCDQPMRPQEQFFLRLARPHAKPLWVHCVVMRWQPVGEKTFVVGARFSGVVDPAQPHGEREEIPWAKQRVA